MQCIERNFNSNVHLLRYWRGKQHEHSIEENLRFKHATDSINKFNLKFIYFVINQNKRKKNVNCFYIKIAVLYA